MLGFGTAAHLVPSQWIARVWSAPLMLWEPTAHMSFALAAATLLRALLFAAEAGPGTEFQCAPSQRIMTACGPLLPTAHISYLETAARDQIAPAPSFGHTFQAVPSQCRKRGLD